MTEVYYKVHQVLQSVTVITKKDVTSLHIFMLYCRYYLVLSMEKYNQSFFHSTADNKMLLKREGNGNLQEKHTNINLTLDVNPRKLTSSELFLLYCIEIKIFLLLM